MLCFWAAPRSLVATEGISVDFFSSGYLDISVPRVRFQHLWIQYWIPLARWVSPFGHRRINACCQLPDAFRRLPRPSSPLTAKASTVYACSLDHITPSRLEVTPNDAFAVASTTHLGSFEPKRLSLVYVFKEHDAGLNAAPFRQSWCAQLLPRPIWWSQSGSNRRPPACKAGALPAELWPHAPLKPPPTDGRALAMDSREVNGGSGRTRTTGLTLIRGAL